MRAVGWSLLVCLLAIAMQGCVVVQVDVANPVPSLSKVAIAPFFNLSQEKAVDGRRFALAYFAELQKISGFQVIPVGVTEQAIFDNHLEMNSPDDAIRLAGILGADIVVIGAITDFDPYYPPRIGLQVSWYSPQDVSLCPVVDSFAVTESPFDESSRRAGRQNHALRGGRGRRVRRTYCIRSQAPTANETSGNADLGDGWRPMPTKAALEPMAEDKSERQRSSGQGDGNESLRLTNDQGISGQGLPETDRAPVLPTPSSDETSDETNAAWDDSSDIRGDAFWQESTFWDDTEVERPLGKPVGLSPAVIAATENAESSAAIIGRRNTRQPFMSYTRLFDGSDANLVARLRDYAELSGDRRSGGWEAYLHRSEDFIRFTSHLMIVEMLTLHGGETRHRFVLKFRKYK